MADKPIRIAVAAKKFNVGVATLVDYLNEKGFEVANRPTTKLDAEMIAVLEEEYQDQIRLKERADKIDIGSARREATETKRDRRQEDGDEEDEIEEPVTKKVQEQKQPEKESEFEIEEEEKEEQQTSESDEKEDAEEQQEEAAGDKIKSEVPKAKVKVVDKIDLSKVNQRAKKKEEPEPVEEEKAKKDKEEVNAKKEEASESKPKEEKKEEEAVAEKQEGETKKIETNFKELSGPKVLGKIELPSNEKKRKRKRIVKKVGSESSANANKKQSNNNKRQNQNTSRKRGRNKEEEQENVSEQEIQDKIKATMARMQGRKTSGKTERSKYKRQKRKEHAEAREMEEMAAEEDNTLTVSEFIPLNELASLMDVAPTELITACFSLGMMVTINQRLDAEVIQLLGEEFGFEIEFASATEDSDIDFDEDDDDPEDLEPRNPIVTVMGHVDHGKTSLLDYIRAANVIAGEAGGITQHIGAYEVTLENDKKITFLDTPGHEAFTAMRARGAKVTDIAIIVIAADDSVMPQTKEAISHAQAAGVPMIFAFNKMDKPGANADKIREELSQMNILVEDWGGEYQAQEISAKNGTNIDELLEKVLLQAELLELETNPDKDAVGTVIEAKLDKGRGYVTTLLVQAGTLEMGDFIVAGQYYGKVKAMQNERGHARKEAGPSVPVEILGLSGAPTAGETFRVYQDESAGKNVANKREQIIREQGLKARKHITLDEIGRRLALGSFKELNIIIKGDVDGSVEAMADSLQKLSTDEVAVNVIHKGVGQITESDILLASASDAVIIAFQVRPSGQARKLAEKEDIEIRMYSVIYDAIDDVKSAMEGMLEPKVEERIICNILVKETFKISKVGTIAGCEVQEGKAKAKMKVRLIRDGIVVYSGELESLKRYKDDVKEVFAGQECGLNIKNYNDVKVGDIIEGYEEIEVKRKLGGK